MSEEETKAPVTETEEQSQSADEVARDIEQDELQLLEDEKGEELDDAGEDEAMEEAALQERNKDEQLEGDKSHESVGNGDLEQSAAADGEDEGADAGEEELEESKGDVTREGEEEDEEEEEEEEEETGDAPEQRASFDPNVMPQVNVQTLAKRKWQVKVYPLKASDFISGNISKVFKDAKESLLYLISSGKYSRGKGEMYISSVNQTLRVVQGLMKRDCYFPEINIEIVKKNQEGVVEEKAYMRFDSKMVRFLFNPINPAFSWGVHGRKRERIIGSVFVKNLPASTSKDMLRVMFPFAQEINYNPEKFKECTARLVLKSRASVIPCLKAFAKVELGGQVLELHPLDKKRANKRDDKSKSSSRRRSRSVSGSAHSDEEKEEDLETEELTSKKTKPESQEGTKEDDKEEASAEKADEEKAKTSSLNQKEKRRSTGPSSSRKPASSSSSKRGDDDKERRERKDSSDRPRKSYRPDSHTYRGGRSDSYRSRGGGYGSMRGRRGNFRGAGERGGRFHTGAARADVARNAEATKDMLVLQNQLSMAIKGQLAVLNQTKMAVEQAKLDAASSGVLGMSDLDRAYDRRLSSRDRRDAGGSGYGQKRKADQASLRQSDRGYGKRAYQAKRPRGRGGARASNYNLYDRDDDYARDLYSRAGSLRGAGDSYGGLGSSSDYYGGYGGY